MTGQPTSVLIALIHGAVGSQYRVAASGRSPKGGIGSLPTGHLSPLTLSGSATRHPDRRSPWVIVSHCAYRDGGEVPPPEVLDARLRTAASAFPFLACRLRSGRLAPAHPPRVRVADGSPLAVAPVGHFDLGNEPPLRVMTSCDSDWLLLCAHHHAFDGSGLVALLDSILTGVPATAPDYLTFSSPRRPPTDALRRLLRPADPVAPSPNPPSSDSFATAEVHLSGPHITAQIAEAATRAVRAHNTQHERPLRRFGLSIAIGGIRGEAATYRRLDLRPNDDVAAAVVRAMEQKTVPTELGGLPPGARLLWPVLNRLSDTILVSNLGRLNLPVRKLEFYPVARGRSAVAFGASGLPGRPTTLTLLLATWRFLMPQP